MQGGSDRAKISELFNEKNLHAPVQALAYKLQQSYWRFFSINIPSVIADAE
jgi:hypothetical protein